jgi:hypothetical protein
MVFEFIVGDTPKIKSIKILHFFEVSSSDGYMLQHHTLSLIRGFKKYSSYAKICMRALQIYCQ